MRAHIANGVLRRFLENQADPSTAARVEGHLESGCRQCEGEVNFWSRSLPALRDAQTPGASEATLERAFALFERFAPKPSVWERIAATLAFDSRLQPSVAGVRAAEDTSRHLLFEAD